MCGLDDSVVKALLGFHGVTGCDTVSQFSGYGKKTAWKTFLKHPQLLEELGKMDVSDKISHDIQQFVIKMYAPSSAVSNINDLRAKLFHQGKVPQKLPPSEDTLKQHVLRANYQTRVWQLVVEPIPTLLTPELCGWTIHENGFKPVLPTIEPLPKD